MNFSKLKDAVSQKFAQMVQGAIFVSSVSPDTLWEKYIGSFREGDNPIYRKRTEHDCSCCRQFIRGIGNIVTIKDGVIDTLWDVKVDEPGYQVVVDAMAALVKQHAIDNVFVTAQNMYGSKPNFSDDNPPVKHTHFHLTVPRQFIRTGDAYGAARSDARANFDVLLRGLKELTPWAIDTVLELTAQGSLYRANEFKEKVEGFRLLKREFDTLSDARKPLYVWEVAQRSAGVSRIRNSAIGTLLVDLSEGLELEQAVAKYERVVAPTNYRRPTALVTPAMVESARTKLAELNLTSALERRHAVFSDLEIANVAYINRDTQAVAVEPDLFAGVATSKAKTFDKVDTLSIKDFLKMVETSSVTKLEVMLENKHQGNFASLIAPVNPTAERLFTWDNPHSWSYRGEVADSIKERVKAAGGNVTGEWCNRLAWNNSDDLDFHMHGPGGMHIYFRDKMHGNIGFLDVDANGGYVTNSINPVENIVFPEINRLPEGNYRLVVNQYSQHSSANPGFEVEIDILGEVHRFSSATSPKSHQDVEIAKFEVKGGQVNLLTPLAGSKKSTTTWGLTSNEFHEVSAIVRSPNFWGDNAAGNLHYFFMLKGCVNDESARGFYNEFLRSDLNEHRKVLELVGSKVKVEKADNQLSGLGFSSTLRNELVVRVTGKFTRVVKVQF